MNDRVSRQNKFAKSSAWLIYRIGSPKAAYLGTIKGHQLRDSGLRWHELEIEQGIAGG